MIGDPVDCTPVNTTIHIKVNMNATTDDMNASVEKLLKTVQDKGTKMLLKRLSRAIPSLPSGQYANTEFAILLERSVSVFDSWLYLSEHPDELKAAILEVEDSLPELELKVLWD